MICWVLGRSEEDQRDADRQGGGQTPAKADDRPRAKAGEAAHVAPYEEGVADAGRTNRRTLAKITASRVMA